MQNDINEDFTGVFYFTNPDNEEFVGLWNNVEHRFAPQTTSPLIIPQESLENIQEIRKRFALRNAEKRFYKSEQYMKMKELGGGMPPTFDPKVLEPMIQECLKPLEQKRAVVTAGATLDNESNYKASKAVGNNEDLNRIFAEESANAPVLGAMPDN